MEDPQAAVPPCMFEAYSCGILMDASEMTLPIYIPLPWYARYDFGIHFISHNSANQGVIHHSPESEVKRHQCEHLWDTGGYR